MNVLFFTPPTKDSFVRLGRCGGKSKGGEKWPPVKLMFAAGAIRDIARVKILDADATMGEKEFLDEVKEFEPNALVFEPTPGTIAYEEKCIEMIKKDFPRASALALGGFATPIAREILMNFKNIDFVIDGESENTLKEFVKTNGKTAVKGMWYQNNGAPVFFGKREMMENLDDLAFPAHDLIDKKIYDTPLIKRHPFTITESSRGCPYPCIFCNAHFMDGKVPRFRSPERMIEEMKFIQECGFKEVKFNDETFTFNKERTLKFTKMMRNEKIDIAWKCNTRADRLDEEILESMAQAGCHTIFMGVESVDPKILKYYRKGVSAKQVENAVRIAKKNKIRTVLHFIFGAPDETWDTIRTSIRFACRVNPDFVGFNVLTPYPGTEVFSDLRKRKLIVSSDWGIFDQSHTAGIRTKNLSPEDLEKASKIANKEFYFRPSYIMKRLADIKNPHAFKRDISGFIELLRSQ